MLIDMKIHVGQFIIIVYAFSNTIASLTTHMQTDEAQQLRIQLYALQQALTPHEQTQTPLQEKLILTMQLVVSCIAGSIATHIASTLLYTSSKQQKHQLRTKKKHALTALNEYYTNVLDHHKKQLTACQEYTAHPLPKVHTKPHTSVPFSTSPYTYNNQHYHVHACPLDCLIFTLTATSCFLTLQYIHKQPPSFRQTLVDFFANWKIHCNTIPDALYMDFIALKYLFDYYDLAAYLTEETARMIMHKLDENILTTLHQTG